MRTSFAIATGICSVAFVFLRAAAGADTLVEAYGRALRGYNSAFSAAASESLASRVISEADAHGLDARLIVALVATESSWRPAAQSAAGASGLGQLMPSTARALGVDASDPEQNVHGTVSYLSQLLRRYRRFGTEQMYVRALGAYNAGPAAVDAYGGLPPYRETQDYVRLVIGRWRKLCGLQPEMRSRPAL